MDAADDPTYHYDHITRAWRYLLGEDFHYGYFRSPNEPLDEATHNLTVLMAEKGAIGREHSVLDVGCGIGSPACVLAQAYGCKVLGISLSQTGVELARQRAAAAGCADRVSFQIADGMNNGLPAGSFDRAWVLEASHLMAGKDALFSECARILRPGGIMVLCDIVSRRPLASGEILRRSREFLHLHYAFGHARLETLAAYRQFAERAGLAVLEALDVSDKAFPTIGHWRHRIHDNAEQVRALIGDEGVEHFRASCSVLDALWKDEVFGYGLVVAGKAG